MGHNLLLRQSSCPEATANTYSGYPRVGFCLSTGRRPGASSTRHRRFPGAKGTCTPPVACRGGAGVRWPRGRGQPERNLEMKVKIVKTTKKGRQDFWEAS